MVAWTATFLENRFHQCLKRRSLGSREWCFGIWTIRQLSEQLIAEKERRKTKITITFNYSDYDCFYFLLQPQLRRTSPTS